MAHHGLLQRAVFFRQVAQIVNHPILHAQQKIGAAQAHIAVQQHGAHILFGITFRQRGGQGAFAHPALAGHDGKDSAHVFHLFV